MLIIVQSQNSIAFSLFWLSNQVAVLSVVLVIFRWAHDLRLPAGGARTVNNPLLLQYYVRNQSGYVPQPQRKAEKNFFTKSQAVCSIYFCSSERNWDADNKRKLLSYSFTSQLKDLLSAEPLAFATGQIFVWRAEIGKGGELHDFYIR